MVGGGADRNANRVVKLLRDENTGQRN